MTSHYDSLAQLDMYIIKRSLVPCKLVYGFPVTFERAAKIGPSKVRGYCTTDPATGFYFGLAAGAAEGICRTISCAREVSASGRIFLSAVTTR